MMATFKHLPHGSVIGSGDYVFRHYGEEAPAPVGPDYLCFTAEEPGSTFLLAADSRSPSVSVEYSTDKTAWNSLPIQSKITLNNVGDKVYLRGDNATFSNGGGRSVSFRMTGKINASGNIMSLFDRSAESLTLNSFACCELFEGCTALTSAPKLPAMTLSSQCYSNMFNGCTALSEAPELPATSVAAYAYYNMFNGCNLLSSVKAKLTDWGNATVDWLADVAASGTFYCPSALDTSIRDASHVPAGWTVVNI